jgi:hypothetical protein
MKRIVVASLVLNAALISTAGAADVGVSIQFAQPGVFGRVDIGQFPQPQVIVQQPVVIAPPQVGVPPPEPVYLWVPLEHRQHWDRYCHQYNACGHPVYFVNHVWYRDHVMAHREHVQERRDERHEEAHHDRGRAEEERGHGRGHEEGRGHDEDEHGHGRGHD